MRKHRWKLHVLALVLLATLLLTSSNPHFPTVMAQEGGGGLVVIPTSLTFTARSGGSAPPAQHVSVSSSTGPLSFAATTSATWLHVSPTSGTTPATLSVSVNPTGLAAGTYTGRVRVYRPNVEESSRYVSVTLNVTEAATPNFAISTSPTSVTVTRGGTGSSAVTVTSLNGFNSAITLGVSGLPTGVTAVFSPNPVTPPANGSVPSTWTFTASSTATTGTFAVTINGTSGSITHTTTVTLTVNTTATPNFTISASPSSVTVTQGATGTSTITVASQNGFSSATTLGVTGLPVGVTATFSPNPVTPPANSSASSTLTFSASTSATASTAQVTVTGTSGALTHSTTISLTISSSTGGGGGNFVLLAWSELGMHCMDGKDYSVMGLLPPFNTIYAKLLTTGTTPTEVTSGVTLTYTAFRDASGSINTTSYGTSAVPQKTNFWSYVRALYLSSPAPDVGLLNDPVQSLTLHPMTYGGGMILDPNLNVWKAEAIPTAPYDDTGASKPYPMGQVVARNSAGQIIATATVVLNVSDDISCKNCHAPNTNSAAMPSGGWINNPSYSADQNTKLNILKKHDDLSPIPVSVLSAVQAEGFNYQSSLYLTALNGGALGNPVVCTTCHSNNIFIAGGLKSGVTGVESMTAAVHTRHAGVTLPGSTTTLDNMTGSTGLTSGCYQCHPGPTTQCQRGVMTGTIPGSTPATCYSCHGNVSRVGASTRTGWLTLPTCQMCHQNGTTYTTTFATTDIGPSGIQRTSTDATFASNPNTPSTGFSLYRFSTGHGGVNCAGCHGAQHAEFPTSQPNDQVYSVQLQGYAGRITECSVCHGTSFATSPNGGPHGMHTVGSAWVGAHPNYVGSHGTASCAYCHGADFRGTSLSMIMTTKALAGHTFPAYHQMNCYDCHNGPGGG